MLSPVSDEQPRDAGIGTVSRDLTGPDQPYGIAPRQRVRVLPAIGWMLAPVYLGIVGVSIVLGSIALAACAILWNGVRAYRGKTSNRADHGGPSSTTTSGLASTHGANTEGPS